MSVLSVELFGAFSSHLRNEPLVGWESTKVQELLGFLLVHRHKPHSRESLATLLWGDRCTTKQARSYLRKAVWQVQQATNKLPIGPGQLLQADTQFIRVNCGDWLDLDVATFEDAFVAVKDIPGRSLDEDAVRLLTTAVSLYRGDLLEGVYADWCYYQRERFKHMYLMMLDKEMAHHEARGAYESAIACGNSLLIYDAARERTHRAMMRLHYANGDRTSALRQFKRCRTLLASELDVSPAPRTLELHARIKQGLPLSDDSPETIGRHESSHEGTPLSDCLRAIREDLGRIRSRIDRHLPPLGSQEP